MDRRDVLKGIGLTMAAGGTAAGAAEDVKLTTVGHDLVATWRERPVFRYRVDLVEAPAGVSPLQTRSGYIHPIHAPNGAIVTDDMNPDHLHQRGVFAAWTRAEPMIDGAVVKADFWNLGSGIGRVRSDGADAKRGIQARLVSEARVGDLWKLVLNETWSITMGPLPSDPDAPDAAFVLDIISRQTPLVPLLLPKYHYGGMAIRGSAEWKKGSAMRVLTSEGKDRVGADSAPARWVDMSGPIGGRTAGVALLEHPGNMLAPNHVRMHPDMPYYVFAVPQKGPVQLEAGKEYVFRYRVVAHNGACVPAGLNRLWEQFQTPVRA